MNKFSGRLPIYLVSLAAICILLFGIRATAPILNPILLAMVITITVLPIPGYLTRRGLPGWLALVLTILVVVLLMALVIATVFFSVTKLATELPTYLADATATASQEMSSEVTGSEASVSTTQYTTELGPLAQGLITTTLELLAQFGMALFIFIFMISAALSLPGAARLGLDPRAPVIGRIGVLTGDIRHYMTILTVINFLVGLGDTVFLMVLGVDYALLWGLLAWFMGYIPSIGFIIALIPPVLMAYAQYGLETAVIVLVGYILINGGVQNFIQPKMMGRGLKINPLVVFVGLFVWGFLLGGIGAILAVPLTVLVLMLMENFEATRFVAVLMRYTGGEKKEEHQRAMEQAKGWWDKARAAIEPKEEPEEQV
ncbi:MAG TPA: AI-2E family transporter [Anaerolineae bacterium]|nr:AI-2E family transporter [Anaerolineae bacterium]